MLLADLGADVVKVELPGTGDPFRAFKDGLYSPHFQTYNRNKRSITLNTKQAADLAQFDALIKRSEEHTSELQSLMRTSYAVFGMKKKQKILITKRHTHHHIIEYIIQHTYSSNNTMNNK